MSIVSAKNPQEVPFKFIPFSQKVTFQRKFSFFKNFFGSKERAKKNCIRQCQQNNSRTIILEYRKSLGIQPNVRQLQIQIIL